MDGFVGSQNTLSTPETGLNGKLDATILALGKGLRSLRLLLVIFSIKKTKKDQSRCYLSLLLNS